MFYNHCDKSELRFFGPLILSYLRVLASNFVWGFHADGDVLIWPAAYNELLKTCGSYDYAHNTIAMRIAVHDIDKIGEHNKIECIAYIHHLCPLVSTNDG